MAYVVQVGGGGLLTSNSSNPRTTQVGALSQMISTVATVGEAKASRVVSNGEPNADLEHSFVPKLALYDTMHQDYHYRIWLLPSTLVLRNPALGVNVPVTLWNTFPNPDPNTYVETQLQDLTGITTDVSPGTAVPGMQLRTINLQVNEDAGFSMNGLIRFVFAAGIGELRLIVSRASIVPVIPDSPVTEKLQWRSSVMQSDDGTEQRVSLRPVPRRITSFNLTVVYPDEANDVIKQLFGDAAGTVVLPLYQYLSSIKAAAPATGTTLLVRHIFGDLRAGDSVMLRDRNGTTELNSIASITGDDIVELDTPLSHSYRKGAWLIPTAGTLFARRVNLERGAADGYATLSTQATDSRLKTPFVRAQNTVVLDTFNGLPLLPQRPIVNSDENASYDSGVRRIDFGGDIATVTPWAHSQVEHEREYLVDRFFTPTEMDWWRKFLDHCRGQTNPFYMPSYRPDLKLRTPLPEEAGVLELTDDRYSTIFYGNTIADQIAIYTEAGVHYSGVSTAVSNENNLDTIGLVTPLPPGPAWTNVERISFLMRARLNTDEVEFEHHQLHSFVRFSIRTTDQ